MLSSFSSGDLFTKKNNTECNLQFYCRLQRMNLFILLQFFVSIALFYMLRFLPYEMRAHHRGLR
jgi:hypothetical protein